MIIVRNLRPEHRQYSGFYIAVTMPLPFLRAPRDPGFTSPNRMARPTVCLYLFGMFLRCHSCTLTHFGIVVLVMVVVVVAVAAAGIIMIVAVEWWWQGQ